MSAKASLQNAQSSIDDAKRKLKRMRSSENVIRELEDAEYSIDRALSEVRYAEI
jgi:hypothetical protein